MDDTTIFVGVDKVTTEGDIIHLFLMGDQPGLMLDLPVHRHALPALLLGLQQAALALPQRQQTSAIPIHCTELRGAQSDTGIGLELVLEGLGSLFVLPSPEQWREIADASEQALQTK